MAHRPDTVEGVVEFCASEGQPTDSVEGLARAAMMAVESPNKVTARVLLDHVEKIDFERIDGINAGEF